MIKSPMHFDGFWMGFKNIDFSMDFDHLVLEVRFGIDFNAWGPNNALESSLMVQECIKIIPGDPTAPQNHPRWSNNVLN